MRTPMQGNVKATDNMMLGCCSVCERTDRFLKRGAKSLEFGEMRTFQRYALGGEEGDVLPSYLSGHLKNSKFLLLIVYQKMNRP
jgi:hypothetical protein